MSNQLSSEVVQAVKHAAANLALEANKISKEIEFTKEELSELNAKQKEIEQTLRAYENFLMSIETKEEANNEQR